MAGRSSRLELAGGVGDAQIVPNGVLGMLLFVAVEVMLFAGLISGFVVVKASALVWPPIGQPRLPVEETLVNTAALLLSGFLFPIRNMPQPLQVISHIVPARYYLAILRGIIVKGSDLSPFWDQMAYLAIYTFIVLTLAAVRFKRQEG